MKKDTQLLSSSFITDRLELIKSEFAKEYRCFPGLEGYSSTLSQPIHTVYGGAQLWKSNTAKKIGGLALKHFLHYAPSADAFSQSLNLEPSILNKTVYERVIKKLEVEAVEDFRIDFEDGYGNRPDSEEDAHAVQAAEATFLGYEEKTLPPFLGIRIKSLSPELMQRSLRTLDLFLNTLLSKTSGQLINNFCITLPKVMVPQQVQILLEALDIIEKKYSLPCGSIPIEIMIETTQAIIDRSGASAIPSLIEIANGRCRGAHFGTYDYTASCDIVANQQKMDHPVCDFAKHVMQVTLGGRGIWLSDGATNIMPIAAHKGDALGTKEIEENKKVVHQAWMTSYSHINHSLATGFYQGWDLHPGQIPIRYAAVYRFFLEGLSLSSERLRNFINKAAQATLVGDVFDDAATGQGLLNYFLRALNCGAITEEEALNTGLSLAEIKSKSFLKIIANRTKNQ